MANGIKTGGRTKGTPNRTTNEIRERFQKLVDDNLTQLENDIKDLEPKERIRTILELSKFVLPTLKATELTTSTENDLKPVRIIFKDFANDND
jgi:uncharacterized protein YjcR